MLVFAVLALTCSTLPTNLPISQWVRHNSSIGEFQITYPPCWTASVAHGSDEGIALSSPDGSFSVSVQVREPKLARSIAHRQFGEGHRTLCHCKAAGHRYNCVEWQDRSGVYRFFAIFVNNHGYLIYTSSRDWSVVDWSDEATRILNTLKFTGRDAG